MKKWKRQGRKKVKVDKKTWMERDVLGEEIWTKKKKKYKKRKEMEK